MLLEVFVNDILSGSSYCVDIQQGGHVKRISRVKRYCVSYGALFPAAALLCLAGTAALDVGAGELLADQCDLTDGTCFSNGAYVSPSGKTPSPYTAARSKPGASAGALDVWGICRYVDNTSSKEYFVPFKSVLEWSAFLPKADDSMTRVHCSRPQAGLIVYPSGACPSPSPTTHAVSEPDYHRWTFSAQAVWTAPVVAFTCSPNNPSDNTGSWTETATGTFEGRDSDTGDSWARIHTAYMADPAACGVATQSSSEPRAGFCLHGIASIVEGSGPWSWTCTTGQPPSPTTSCSTLVSPPVCQPDGSTHAGLTWPGNPAQNDCRSYQAVLDSCGNQIGSNVVGGDDCACVPDGTTHVGATWTGNAAFNDCRTYQGVLDSCNNQIATNVISGGDCPPAICVPNGSITYGPVTGGCDGVGGSTTGATNCSYSRATYDSCGTYLGDYSWGGCSNGCT